jgi:hypothetical protein
LYKKDFIFKAGIAKQIVNDIISDVFDKIKRASDLFSENSSQD